MLGEPLGWNEKKFKDNQELQDEYLEELHLSTYGGFQKVLFWDVIQALAKLYFVRLEMKEHMRAQL
jgi:hypothetical protein